MLELLLASKVAATPPPSGLPDPVHMWLFGSDYNDSMTPALNGTPTSATLTTFSGRAAVRLLAAYVSIGAYQFGSGNWSFSTMFAGVSWDGYAHLFTALTQDNFAIKVGSNADGIGGRLYFYTAGSGNKMVTNVLSLNTWYHIVFTYNAGTLRVYLNKALIGTFTGLSLNIPSTQFRIGQGNGDEYTNGYQANTRIYNVALTQEQINELYDLMYV